MAISSNQNGVSIIEVWQRTSLSQAKYCAAQPINVRTFSARLGGYRK